MGQLWPSMCFHAHFSALGPTQGVLLPQELVCPSQVAHPRQGEKPKWQVLVQALGWRCRESDTALLGAGVGAACPIPGCLSHPGLPVLCPQL